MSPELRVGDLEGQDDVTVRAKVEFFVANGQGRRYFVKGALRVKDIRIQGKFRIKVPNIPDLYARFDPEKRDVLFLLEAESDAPVARIGQGSGEKSLIWDMDKKLTIPWRLQHIGLGTASAGITDVEVRRKQVFHDDMDLELEYELYCKSGTN